MTTSTSLANRAIGGDPNSPKSSLNHECPFFMRGMKGKQNISLFENTYTCLISQQTVFPAAFEPHNSINLQVLCTPENWDIYSVHVT